MIFKLLYDDHAKLQMELLRVAGVLYSHEFHTETYRNWIGELEDITYVTIETRTHHDS